MKNVDEEDVSLTPGGALSSALTHMRTVSAFSMETKVSAVCPDFTCSHK